MALQSQTVRLECQCDGVMLTACTLLNVVSCGELRSDAPFEVVFRTELLYYKIGNFICMLINMIIQYFVSHCNTVELINSEIGLSSRLFESGKLFKSLKNST